MLQIVVLIPSQLSACYLSDSAAVQKHLRSLNVSAISLLEYCKSELVNSLEMATCNPRNKQLK